MGPSADPTQDDGWRNRTRQRSNPHPHPNGPATTHDDADPTRYGPATRHGATASHGSATANGRATATTNDAAESHRAHHRNAEDSGYSHYHQTRAQTDRHQDRRHRPERRDPEPGHYEDDNRVCRTLRQTGRLHPGDRVRSAIHEGC